jgi:acyl carrier protein|tara:strand:+ start:76 stop:300 length:225 start_codon:yes stop_codon:yes gene_type:complete
MEEKILNIIKDVFELEDIDNNVSQDNCIKWDSLNHLNLILEIEMEFDVSFDPEEIAEIKSASNILSLLKKRNLN